ncbi:MULTISPECIES: methyltransferase domain-containing protein [unclassified Sporolactobacillus]|uniref:methyltransferase domain-containing protein n=1 Tax=unclassified Sporolactobacillus TaxID=2628533 RepID=UPI002367DCAD|nr:methyltransferase domain-containing protein [Sporolactobacillus sp. CQH2019]MDD9149667.1 methyltransferase domain-containing protein [Sporolactobacillus sp. CQH2019]
MSIYEKIDKTYKKIWLGEQIKDDWLLLQTILTGISRRKFAEGLSIQDDKFKVLDVGTGFGALSIDIASQYRLIVEAIDIDESKIQVAQKIYNEIKSEEDFLGQINFKQQNVEHLDYPDNSFDLAVSRFVFQHLTNPVQAAKEIKRVLKQGGTVCIIDVDDSFTVEYPVDESQEILKKALMELQVINGGDRHIGRKLAGYLNEAGLEIQSVNIDTYAEFVRDPSLLLLQKLSFVKRFMAIEEEIIEHSLLTEKEFNYHFANAYDHIQRVKFLNDSRFIVRALKP